MRSQSPPPSPPPSPPSSPPRNVAPVLIGPVTLGDVELPLYAFNPSLHTKNRIADRKMDPQYQIACDGVDFYTFAELQQSHEKRSSVSVDRTNPRDVITLGEVSDRFDVTLYRFVILADGRMICGRNDPYEEFSHQNMVSRYNVRRSKGLTFRERCLGSLSDNVLVAGEIGLDSLGRIQYVSNRTGHYRVPPGVLRDVVYPCLEAHGITVENINFMYEQEYTQDQPEHDPKRVQRVSRKENYSANTSGLVETLRSAQKPSIDLQGERSRRKSYGGVFGGALEMRGSSSSSSSSSSAQGSLSSLGLHQKKKGSRKKSCAGGNLGDALEDNQSVFALSQYESSPNKEDMPLYQRGLFGQHKQNKNGLIDSSQLSKRGRGEKDGSSEGRKSRAGGGFGGVIEMQGSSSSKIENLFLADMLCESSPAKENVQPSKKSREENEGSSEEVSPSKKLCL